MREVPVEETATLNVQAVAIRTGVTAETLRTWERRYGWPRPRRSPKGYRMYAEDDVAMILAVKHELEAGVSAAAAWQRVLAAQRRCLLPASIRESELLSVELPDALFSCEGNADAPNDFVRMGRVELLRALLSFEGDRATMLLAQAHATYPLEQVLTEIVQPILVEIGNQWHEGKVTVAQEHFASNLLRDNLVTISSFYRPRPGAQAIMLGAGPGELHDIGPLMLALLLRRNRFRVLYLGQSVALDQLPAALQQLRPHLLVLSAAQRETAYQLQEVPRLVARISPPRPLFAFGGRAFEGHHDLVEAVDGIYIPGDAVRAADRIEALLA